MRSPRSAFAWLLRKEARELASSASWWVLAALVGPLVGVAFISAVNAYSEVSAGAGAGCGIACTPLIGIWGPTLGAYEIAAVFLLPFVAIRAVAGDRQSGALILESQRPAALAVVALLLAPLAAQQVTVDLSKEAVGRPPNTFEPIMGIWTIAQDGADKVVKLDGVAWKAAQDAPTRMLIESARKLYGTTNEELMDNAKQFTNYPIAVLRTVDAFSNGSISMKFKTVSGDSDRASGILFNVKPNGDWLSVRYNDPEHNIAFWEFHNGVRRAIARGQGNVLTDPADRDRWHEMRLDVDGASLKASIDGAMVLEMTLGSEPRPGRNGAPPHPDLFAKNNPVLQPPVAGRVGLWSKGDSTSLFKDYVVAHQK